MAAPPATPVRPRTATTVQIAELLWVRVPAAVRRFAPGLSATLADGGYLRAWPSAAVAAPLALLGVGLLYGAVHPFAAPPGGIYLYSLFVVSALAAVGAFGAGLGCWAWFGFVAGDLLAADRSSLPGFAPGSAPRDQLTEGFLPLLLSYAALALLVVVLPVLADEFARRAAAARKPRRIPDALLAEPVRVASAALGAYGWALAIPYLVRPLWSYSGRAVDPGALAPIQQHGGWLVLAVAAATAGRVAVSRLAGGRGSIPPAVRPTQPRGDRLGFALRLIGVPLAALGLVLLLSGLLSHAWQGFFAWLVVDTLLFARLLLVPMIPRYPGLLRRVPLLLRVVGTVLAGYGGWLVVAGLGSGRLVVAALTGLVASALLLPAGPPNRPPATSPPTATPPPPETTAA
jgi:hypothetical protein